MAGMLDRVAGALRRALSRLAGGKRTQAEGRQGEAATRPPPGGGQKGAAATKRAAGAKRAAGGAKNKRKR